MMIMAYSEHQQPQFISANGELLPGSVCPHYLILDTCAVCKILNNTDILYYCFNKKYSEEQQNVSKRRRETRGREEGGADERAREILGRQSKTL